jgi:2'-5' RNA ligase
VASDTIRAFVALEIEAPCRERIVALTRDLRQRIPEVRWAHAEQLHLTLRFLGDSTRAALARLTPELARAAEACAPAEVSVAGLGLFPERGAPRVLWLALDLPAPLLVLQSACEAAAVAAGFARDGRPFQPHLTLGRWRSHAPRPSLPPADLGLTHLSRLTLFQSELRPEGATHTQLATFELGSRP